jgi:hypothetical protein
VTFYWADSQQQGFSGASTDFLTVTLGSSPGQSTPTVPDNSQSFTPWISQTFDFTATGASEVLSFLATGTPTNGIAPAFALLDDVTVTQLGTPPPGMTPEPSSLMLLATGLVVMSGFIRWRMAKGQAV